MDEPEDPMADMRRASDLIRIAGQATRLQVLLLLDQRERCVSEIRAALGTLNQPAISAHLTRMRKAGVIKRRREGRTTNYYSLTPKGRMLVGGVEVMLGGVERG